MDTPESIRLAYLPSENETPEQRRKRLASKRAAKYRYFSKVDDQRREQHSHRQKRWLESLDNDDRQRIREQNRLRQKERRTRLTEKEKSARNEKQRLRRARLDENTLAQLREREKLRARQRRQSRDGNNTDTPAIAWDSSAASHAIRSTPATVLPSAASVLGGSLGSRIADLLDELPPGNISRSQFQPQLYNQHAPIGIAPLQFVLPPASSIQSLTFADRMAPLPQVQNVLPHASTLFNAAATQSMPVPMPLAPSSSTSASALGALLNPQPLPSLPHATSMPGSSSQAVLPSLSQLPELLVTSSSTRDLFDGVSSSTHSAHGFFRSVADFTGEF